MDGCTLYHQFFACLFIEQTCWFIHLFIFSVLYIVESNCFFLQNAVCWFESFLKKFVILYSVFRCEHWENFTETKELYLISHDACCICVVRQECSYESFSCAHACMCVLMFTHACVCVHVCEHISVLVFMHVYAVYAYTHT